MDILFRTPDLGLILSALDFGVDLTMSPRSSSLASDDSDSHLGSRVYRDVEPPGPRKLNCKVLDRSTSSCRRTRCESKLWPVERDFHDHDILSRTFGPSSLACSEGSRRSETQQCLDGSYDQSLCIAAAKDGHESEIDGVENDQGNEEEQGDEENLGRVTETDDERRTIEEAESDKSDVKILSLSGDISNHTVAKPSSTSGSGTKSSACPKIKPLLRNPSAEQTIGSFSESQVGVLSGELGHASSLRFGEGADNISESGGRGKESQLAERGSGSHDFFSEGLDVVGSRKGDERGGVQKGVSSGWGSPLSGAQEQLSFQREDTVECITNVGEEDEFGFEVEEFQTPDGQEEEPTQETPHAERREFHDPRRGEQSPGIQDGQRITRAKFENPQDETEKTLRARARLPTHLWPSDQDLEGSRPQADAAAGGSIPERVETGPGRLGRVQERDDKHRSRVEGHQRKGEVSVLASEERRVRARLDSSVAGSGRGEETEEAKVVVRPSRPSGGKDRHSKVNTAKGPRDRRVRLSVPTAVQFYDVQDRLGYDQPSKAVEWLIKKAKTAIDELGRLPVRGNEGPSAMSDITHPSPFSAALSLSGPVSGGSSCPPVGSFSASLSGPFGDVGNHMNYFLDSSIQHGMSFGNHPVLQNRDIGGVGLSQVHLTTGQGHHLTGFGFPLGQTDLSRGNSGCTEGFRAGEFGLPLGRTLDARVKARERARERVKSEKCSVGGSSPSMQSPPLHPSTPIHSFTVQNALQGSIHSLSLQTPHQNSLSSVFNTTLSGIMQSSQPGTLQNLIMQNPSLQSSLTDPDQVQSSLQHSFQVSLESTLQGSLPSTSIQNPGMQQSHLQTPSLQGSAQPQGALHYGSGFAPGPCSSSFSESSLSPSHYMSVSPLPISQALNVSQLSALGISSPSSMGSHFSGNPTVPIPPGFSPGPPASAFRPRPMPIGQGSHNDLQQHQGASRPQLLASYNPASGSPTGSSSSKVSPSSLYYSNTSSRMGSHQSMPPLSLKSPSFSSGRNLNYDFQRGLQMMSPGGTSSSFQTSSSQIPARIHGLSDDFEGDLDSPPPSPPDVHP